MKKILLALLCLAAAFGAKAQYYQMANQVTNMLQSALLGGMQYRGSVEASYLRGLASDSPDFWEFTTTHGLKYSNWFFMGVGAGLDVLHAPTGEMPLHPLNGKQVTRTGYMVPLYSDFRFNIGSEAKTSAFIDLRLGASFLMGNSCLPVGGGYINGNECFYLRPSVGVRLPVSAARPKLALNFGVSYLLVATDYWNSSNNVALSSLGLTVGFEW